MEGQAMKEALSGHRMPRWRYMLLDSNDQPVQRLDGVEGGSIELAALSRLGASGSLTITDVGQGIDWMTQRVKITYDPGVRGVDAWDIAVMCLTRPIDAHQAGGGIVWDVELLSKLSVPDGDGVDTTFSLAEGTEIIPAVVALLESTGEKNLAVTPSDAKLKSQQVWEAGTSKLTILNELLELAGYWSLWCDGSGQFRIEPYVAPGDRVPVWEFEQGQLAVHEPEWSREQDLAAVPNKFIVSGAGDDEEPGPVGVAKNEDPNSPFSYQNRGERWITETEQGVDVEDEAAATRLAERRLADRMAPVAKLTVSHMPLPIAPNEVVTFDDSGHSARASVMSMRLDLEDDTLCAGEWRETT